MNILYIYTVYGDPMSVRLHQFEIPVPANPALLAAYEALGWYRLDDPPRLKWSHARGSPRHPGEAHDTSVRHRLQLLDSWLVRDLAGSAPLAYHHAADTCEVRAVVTVKLRKVAKRHPRKSWPAIMSWEVTDVELTILPPDHHPAR